MKTDIERWEHRYRSNPKPAFDPDPLLVSYAGLLRPGERVLDVACGVGANALHLARRGCEVYAVDGSVAGLRFGVRQAEREGLELRAFVADLDDCPLPPCSFDGIVVIRYLNRDLIARLEQALRPGGLLICRTFNINLLRHRPTFNPAFLLAPGELARLLGHLAAITTNDGPHIAQPLTHWVGTRAR